jgi:hypothetical protein
MSNTEDPTAANREADDRMNATLKRMLNTPPKPHTTETKTKTKKLAKPNPPNRDKHNGSGV